VLSEGSERGGTCLAGQRLVVERRALMPGYYGVTALAEGLGGVDFSG